MGSWVRVFSSTVIAPNRERDKSRVENFLGLSEFGDAFTEFYSVKQDLLPVAMGYDRIVYGDHGPYVEFSSHQIYWSTFPTFLEKPAMSFFDEYYTANGLSMLYAQKRSVVNKPNPPSGPWSSQNNRPEGYANYLIGKFYLACEPDTIAVRRPTTKSAARRKRAAAKSKGQNQSQDEEWADELGDWWDEEWWEEGPWQESAWGPEAAWSEFDTPWPADAQGYNQQPWSPAESELAPAAAAEETLEPSGAEVESGGTAAAT